MQWCKLSHSSTSFHIGVVAIKRLQLCRWDTALSAPSCCNLSSTAPYCSIGSVTHYRPAVWRLFNHVAFLAKILINYPHCLPFWVAISKMFVCFGSLEPPWRSPILNAGSAEGLSLNLCHWLFVKTWTWAGSPPQAKYFTVLLPYNQTVERHVHTATFLSGGPPWPIICFSTFYRSLLLCHP